MSESEETIWDPISSLGRVMPPSDFVLDSSRSSFSQTKKNWPERLLITTSLNTTNPNTCEIHFPPNFPFKKALSLLDVICLANLPYMAVIVFPISHGTF